MSPASGWTVSCFAVLSSPWTDQDWSPSNPQRSNYLCSASHLGQRRSFLSPGVASSVFLARRLRRGDRPDPLATGGRRHGHGCNDGRGVPGAASVCPIDVPVRTQDTDARGDLGEWLISAFPRRYRFTPDGKPRSTMLDRRTFLTAAFGAATLPCRHWRGRSRSWFGWRAFRRTRRQEGLPSIRP